ncbi:hypothetical protein CDAR_622901 [Caerostris darwini]|uniref:Uncharacterized protein n=1 Tax=Caerostris darwini TaxID=1538125 RepID=A0AAV4WIF0_9ARAC|nr:hypothetical protein CDAR_622901 [Caerostris darwini]
MQIRKRTTVDESAWQIALSWGTPTAGNGRSFAGGTLPNLQKGEPLSFPSAFVCFRVTFSDSRFQPDAQNYSLNKSGVIHCVEVAPFFKTMSHSLHLSSPKPTQGLSCKRMAVLIYHFAVFDSNSS